MNEKIYKEMMDKWLEHFIKQKKFHSFGITANKLKKYKNSISKYESLKSDMYRHSAFEYDPESEYWKQNKEIYSHLMGNINGIITELFWKNGLIK